MKIIPAIDIDGKCVRLTQGDYGRKPFTMKILSKQPKHLKLPDCSAFPGLIWMVQSRIR